MTSIPDPKPCDRCEDAAKICELKESQSTVEMFKIAMRLAATAIRSSCRHRPSPAPAMSDAEIERLRNVSKSELTDLDIDALCDQAKLANRPVAQAEVVATSGVITISILASQKEIDEHEKVIAASKAALSAPRIKGWTHVNEGLPDGIRRVLVTNNINGRDAYGEPSHLWLVGSIHKDSGSNAYPNSYCAFSEGDAKLRNITHWRYALTAAKGDNNAG